MTRVSDGRRPSWGRQAWLDGSVPPCTSVDGTLAVPSWLLGAAVLIANWPFTLLGIMPTNNMLMATKPSAAGPETRRLIEKWGGLHAVRTALGFAATLIFLWASLR